MTANDLLVCTRCAAEATTMELRCPRCGGPVMFPFSSFDPTEVGSDCGIWRWSSALPTSSVCTLGEGATPLIRMVSNEPPTLMLKLESRNPTGSFKDRGSAAVVGAAVHLDRDRLTIASTGNAAASTAAYAARAGLEMTVIVPEWCEPAKLWNTACHGGVITIADGGFDAAERQYRRLVERGWFPVGSDNPYRTEGTKTIAYEIVTQLGDRPADRVIVPIGTGGLIWSMYKGLHEALVSGLIQKMPAIDGVRVEGTPPLGISPSAPQRSNPATVATGIDIEHPMLADEALMAIRATGGRLHTVSDRQVLAAQELLVSHEGITCEPTGAVSVAACLAAADQSPPSELVVAVITGSLKSPEQLSSSGLLRDRVSSSSRTSYEL